MRYRVIRQGVFEIDDVVVNEVEWDGQSSWTPPDGCKLVPIEDGPDAEPDLDAIEATRLMHEALGLLSSTDFVVTKAYETARTLSPDWLAWRNELRAIVSERAGVIREEPPRWELYEALDGAIEEHPEGDGGDAPADPLGPLEALKAKIDAVRAGTQELSPQELIDMHRDDPPGAAAKLEDAIRALKGEARRKLSELLNVELAELKNLRGMAGEDREREQQIEYLLGLFTRLGEI